VSNRGDTPGTEGQRGSRALPGGVSRRAVVKSAIVPAVALLAHQARSQAEESTRMPVPEDRLTDLSAAAQAALIRDGQLASEEQIGRAHV